MSRTKKNRMATFVLASALLAATSAPAHAFGGLEAKGALGIWKWLVEVWVDHGVAIDPNGRSGLANAWGENGVAIDPNGAPQSAPNTASAPGPHSPETH
jgi:hypothetical protein